MDRLEEIKRRVSLATSRPWYMPITVGGLPMVIHDGDEIVDFPRKWMNKRYNIDFIAHAHQDIPWLLAEVERLSEVLQVAAERTYMSDVIETGMKESWIGEGKEYADKQDWIDGWLCELAAIAGGAGG